MKLEEWRKEIDTIDEEIIKLIQQRARVVKKIGSLKAKAGLPIIDNNREDSVILNICSKNEGIISNESLTGIYRKIILESRKVQAEEIKKTNRKGVEIY